MQLIKFLKWKNDVDAFIAKVQGTTGRIECTTTAFIYSNPEETCILRWEEIKQVRIFPHYLLICTHADKFTFIAATMEPDEYRNLCELLERIVAGSNNLASLDS
jgi:hypothetical protein